MATRYFLMRDGQESGPYAFRELVSLVREGRLSEADPVRFASRTEWQRAESLVGLFHQARKSADELARFYALQEPENPAAREIAPPVPADGMEVDDRPGWMRRLLQVGGCGARKPGGRETPIFGPPAVASPTTAGPTTAGPTTAVPDTAVPDAAAHRPETADNQATAGAAGVALVPELAAYAKAPAAGNPWDSAVEEALSEVESHRSPGVAAAAGRWGRLAAWRRWLRPRGAATDRLLRLGFRLACAFACANLVAGAIDDWTAREAQRFPGWNSREAAPRRFPLWGECTRNESLVLTFDVMLVSGCAAYLAARWVERQAE